MDRRLAPGLASGAVLLAVVGAAGGALLSVAGRVDFAGLLGDRYVMAVLRFTIWQAFLSAVLSVALAVPIARALARRQRFPGRQALLRLLGLPMVVPTIVGVLGIVAVYGRSGVVNTALAWLDPGLRLNIYGLSGILIAHVFFNMPFATRLLLQGWSGIPGESWRLAGQLGMTSGQIFRLIELPMLRQVVPGIAGLVFLLCFTSFAVVLVLGGGPPRATLEVAIYQALRFDFDLGQVVALSVLQIAACGLLVGAGHRLARHVPAERTLHRGGFRPDLDGIGGRIGDAVAILLGAAVALLPLAAVVAAGLPALLTTDALAAPALWRAALRSLAVGLSAGILACLLGWGLVSMSRELRVRLYRPTAAGVVETAGAMVLVVPPMALGAGLFVLLRPVADVFAIGLVLVVLVNALMGLPFVMRIMGPPAVQAHERYLRLADSLGMAGASRLRLVDWPLLRRPLGLALALTTSLSLGDFGAIALFGTEGTETLPYLLYRQMGAYRMDDAAVTALVLIGLILGLFVTIERGVGRLGGN